ncbi:LuxR family transcriptional regulator [Candidatus Omnitrophus magneticus]|uniref:LuxR family transcriptional regulator n=1 Tax=Candidatus Omnitrophus magneticus TaxID=1609969 RepID=A0A0F0CT06_9BACT|nr:LuxR family transcriptional regulator [Candidatus Omnitrophus magneticus]
MNKIINFFTEKLNVLADILPDAVFAIDKAGKVIVWNKMIEEVTGVKSGNMLGKCNHEYSIPFYGGRVPILIDLLFKLDADAEKKYKFIKKHKDVLIAERKYILNGSEKYLWEKACLIYDENNKILGAIEFIRDMTQVRKMEKRLLQFKYRIHEQNGALKQKNVDLNDIMSQVESEKKHLKNNVTDNVERIMLPLLKRIKLKNESAKYLKLLQKGLEDIVSSFGASISQNKLNLTSREIEISNLIKNGLTGKEIASLLNISFLTVEMHRKTIRRKLGISNKKVNLASYLNTILSDKTISPKN